MAVTELIFIRLVSACQFWKEVLHLISQNLNKWFGHRWEDKDCLHIRHSFFFILERALEKEILEANEINFQNLCMMQLLWIAIKPSGNTGDIFQTLMGVHW